jgi:hypothetical protein
MCGNVIPVIQSKCQYVCLNAVRYALKIKLAVQDDGPVSRELGVFFRAFGLIQSGHRPCRRLAQNSVLVQLGLPTFFQLFF